MGNYLELPPLPADVAPFGGEELAARIAAEFPDLVLELSR
jgi:hypothetical protein